MIGRKGLAKLNKYLVLVLSLALAILGGCSLGESSTPTPIPIPTITPLARVTIAPLPSPGPTVTLSPTPTSAPLIHMVKSGDSLATLSEQYQTSVEAIMQANNLTDPHMIKIGQELVIPRAPTGR